MLNHTGSPSIDTSSCCFGAKVLEGRCSRCDCIWHHISGAVCLWCRQSHSKYWLVVKCDRHSPNRIRLFPGVIWCSKILGGGVAKHGRELLFGRIFLSTLTSQKLLAFLRGTCCLSQIRCRTPWLHLRGTSQTWRHRQRSKWILGQGLMSSR